MSEVRRYVIEDVDRNQSTEVWEQHEISEARVAAAKRRERCAVIALVYEYSDSELVEVFDADGRSTGEDVFP